MKVVNDKSSGVAKNMTCLREQTTDNSYEVACWEGIYS